jgi:hypothetical protein
MRARRTSRPPPRRRAWRQPARVGDADVREIDPAQQRARGATDDGRVAQEAVLAEGAAGAAGVEIEEVARARRRRGHAVQGMAS